MHGKLACPHGDPARPGLAVAGGRVAGGRVRSSGIERVLYLDLLRPVAIGGVVYGHWLLIDLTYSGGRFTALDALDYVGWGRWLTRVFQVMPVFFLVGGYANAQSWTAHHARGGSWNWWIQRRAMRLCSPTAVCVGSNAVAIVAEKAAGAVPASMAVALAAVSVGVNVVHLRALGCTSFLLVWGSIHQWGFAWRDGILTRPRWRPYALAAAAPPRPGRQRPAAHSSHTSHRKQPE